jgi:hypothetical protein
VGSGGGTLSRVRVGVFQMTVVASSGDITSYRSFGGGGRDPAGVSGTAVQQDGEGVASTVGDRWAGPKGTVLRVLSVKKAEGQW